MSAFAKNISLLTETLDTMKRVIAKPAPDIFVCSRRFREGCAHPILILYRGEKYFRCDEHLLGKLRAGSTPEDLDLFEGRLLPNEEY